MIHTRRALVWFTAAVFTLFMIFSIPHPALNPGHAASLEQSALEAADTLRRPENHAALHSSAPAKTGDTHVPFYRLAVPAAAMSLLLASAGAYFRPFFYQLMKRFLLLPIKFTSIYAA